VGHKWWDGDHWGCWHAQISRKREPEFSKKLQFSQSEERGGARLKVQLGTIHSQWKGAEESKKRKRRQKLNREKQYLFTGSEKRARQINKQKPANIQFRDKRERKTGRCATSPRGPGKKKTLNKTVRIFLTNSDLEKNSICPPLHLQTETTSAAAV